MGKWRRLLLIMFWTRADLRLLLHPHVDWGLLDRPIEIDTRV